MVKESNQLKDCAKRACGYAASSPEPKTPQGAAGAEKTRLASVWTIIMETLENTKLTVWRRCNSCNIRRTRCTGSNPCKECEAAGRQCVYPSAADERITISRATYQDLQANESLLKECLAAAVPSQRQRMELMKRVRRIQEESTLSPRLPGETETKSPSPEPGEVIDGGRFLADPDGQRRFMGNASGAAFLDQLREFAATVLPLVSRGGGNPETLQIQDSFANLLGKYQTHDSRPLSLAQVDPYFLPPLEEAERLLSFLPSLTQGTSSVSIYYWGPLPQVLKQVYSSNLLNDPDTASILLATLNAALALAAQQSGDWLVAAESGNTYFARANILLGRPLDAATRHHIPCLALMGYYLLGANRRDAAYSYIRMAGHISITYGYHQSWMTGEVEKRQFWTVYVLDRYMFHPLILRLHIC